MLMKLKTSITESFSEFKNNEVEVPNYEIPDFKKTIFLNTKMKKQQVLLLVFGKKLNFKN